MPSPEAATASTHSISTPIGGRVTFRRLPAKPLFIQSALRRTMGRGIHLCKAWLNTRLRIRPRNGFMPEPFTGMANMSDDMNRAGNVAEVTNLLFPTETENLSPEWTTSTFCHIPFFT